MNTSTVIGYDLLEFGGFWAVVAFFSTRAPGHPMVRNTVRVMAMRRDFEGAAVIWWALLAGHERSLPVVVNRRSRLTTRWRRV